MSDATCAFPTCGNPQRGKGPYCEGHRQQARKGQTLRPLRVVTYRSDIPVTARDELGQKHCGKCKTWLPEAEFHKDASANDGLRSRCKGCHQATHHQSRYNLTPEQYAALLSAQNGGCAICGGQSTDGKGLHVDHDHSCCAIGTKVCGKCVRGLLCNDCNHALGKMQDDPARLRKAADYLEGH